MAFKPIQLFLATGVVATLAASGGTAPVEEDAVDEAPTEEVAPDEAATEEEAPEAEGGEGGEGE